VKIYNRYILSVASLLLLSTVILTAIGITSLAVYYVTYVVEALVVTELYVYFNPRVRRRLSVIGIVLFAGVIVVASLKAIKILT